jgi:hypothetical protein
VEMRIISLKNDVLLSFAISIPENVDINENPKNSNSWHKIFDFK